jgi:hypothetical protein
MLNDGKPSGIEGMFCAFAGAIVDTPIPTASMTATDKTASCVLDMAFSARTLV